MNVAVDADFVDSHFLHFHRRCYFYMDQLLGSTTVVVVEVVVVPVFVDIDEDSFVVESVVSVTIARSLCPASTGAIGSSSSCVVGSG